MAICCRYLNVIVFVIHGEDGFVYLACNPSLGGRNPNVGYVKSLSLVAVEFRGIYLAIRQALFSQLRRHKVRDSLSLIVICLAESGPSY